MKTLFPAKEGASEKIPTFEARGPREGRNGWLQRAVEKGEGERLELWRSLRSDSECES